MSRQQLELKYHHESTQNSEKTQQTSLCIPCLRGFFTLLVFLYSATPLNAQTHESNLESRPLYQELRQALDDLADAELARETTSLSVRNAKQIGVVREQCRQALSQLLKLEAEFAAILQKTYAVRPSQRDPNGWTIVQLESLLRNLKVQLARGYRNQALCYPNNSPDRTNSLRLALEQLPDVVALPFNDRSVWLARVEQVTCLRLSSKRAEARNSLDRWQPDAPANIVSRLTGERLRLAMDDNDLESVLSILGAIQHKQQPNDATVPETDEAILEALLFARSMTLAKDARRLLTHAITQVQRIAKKHGVRWKRRAESRLGRAIADQTETDDPQLLGYAANSLYNAGQPREAVAIYDRIAKRLADQEHSQQQFQAQKTAAAILREIKDPTAIRRFRELALQHPQHAEAADLHLIAIGLAAEKLRNSPVDQRNENFERYLNLLKEHLQQWPDRPSTEQVQPWLADAEQPTLQRQRIQTLVTKGNRQQAIELHRKLLLKNPDDAKQIEAFAKLLAAGSDQQERREALRLWKQIETRSKPGGPRWWRSRRARLTLLEQLGEGEQAEKLKQLTEILYPVGANGE